MHVKNPNRQLPVVNTMDMLFFQCLIKYWSPAHLPCWPQCRYMYVSSCLLVKAHVVKPDSLTCRTHANTPRTGMKNAGGSRYGDAPVEFTSKKEKNRQQMSEFIFRFLEENHSWTNRGHHCVSFFLQFCSSVPPPSEGPGSQNTHSKHTSRHAQTHFWPSFRPPPPLLPSSRYLQGV